MSKKRIVSVKYTSREFDTIKRDLIDYIKRYYPNTYRDFNEASFGSLMIDTVSYIGDVLSFYIDYQANESFLETATEYNNILKLARQLGFKFRAATSSFGIACFYILIPASATGIGPDLRYMPILKKGATFSTSSGSSFILNHDVHFGAESSKIRVARVDETTGNPKYYAVKATGEVVSGRLDTEFVEIGDFKKFRKVTLSEPDISEVISVIDTEGNEYYEVDYMSQNVLYRGVTNRSKTLGNNVLDYSPGDQAAEILKPVVVPRRFISNRNARTTELVFGASSDYEIERDYITEPQTSILEVHGKQYLQDTSLDPTNLIKSDKMGVAPSNTVLTVSYRLNTSDEVNIRTGQLSNVQTYQLDFEDEAVLNPAEIVTVTQSIEVDNEEPIIGDVTTMDSEELKHRVRDVFATQNRAVTQQDYESFIYQMPPRFGSIKRCRIMRDNDSLKRNLNLYVVSEDFRGSLVKTNDILKRNVKTWIQKNKMINDTIDILDAKMINLGIEFVAVGAMEKSKFDVLESAKQALITRFRRIPDIGEPFFITDVYKELRNVDGVVDVTDVKISVKASSDGGRNYSATSVDIGKLMSPDGRYIEMPRNVVYEVKYPNFDIKGVIV